MVRSFLKKNYALVLLLVLAAFFRFYKFYQFQYFGGDEEVLTATIRHIIWDKSPSLIVQNANLGFGLGPFYHFLLAPFYYIFNFDLPNLQALASLSGILTTYLVFLGAKEIGGKKLGLTAAFLYASSFLISLFDRRLVHLTLDPVLSAFTFFCLTKVINKNFRYLALLAIPIGFSFHADPSLIVLTIGIFLSLIFYRLPIKKTSLLAGLLILIIFVSPLVLAEFLYKGAVVKPIIQSLSRPLKTDFSSRTIKFYSPMKIIDAFAGVIFTAPSQFIENHFCYCETPPPLFSPFTQILVLLALMGGLIYQLKLKPSKEKKTGWLLWILFLGFLLSIYFYHQVFKADFFQHYFMVFWPIFIIILARSLLLVERKAPLVFYSLLIFYGMINCFTLVKSSVKYPLVDKIKLIKATAQAIGEKQFSIKASGAYVDGGGWTELYNHYFRPAVKSYQYDYWGWIYSAYSLYPGPIQTEEPERIVYFYKEEQPPNYSLKLISRLKLKDIQVDILDNSITK